MKSHPTPVRATPPPLPAPDKWMALTAASGQLSPRQVRPAAMRRIGGCFDRRPRRESGENEKGLRSRASD